MQTAVSVAAAEVVAATHLTSRLPPVTRAVVAAIEVGTKPAAAALPMTLPAARCLRAAAWRRVAAAVAAAKSAIATAVKTVRVAVVAMAAEVVVVAASPGAMWYLPAAASAAPKARGLLVAPAAMRKGVAHRPSSAAEVTVVGCLLQERLASDHTRVASALGYILCKR